MRIFIFQVGQFFLVIGVIMLAVFFVTAQSGNPQYMLFMGGIIIVLVGVALMTRNRQGLSSESARFRAVRRYRQKARDRREQKRKRSQEERNRSNRE